MDAFSHYIHFTKDSQTEVSRCAFHAFAVY